jgi:hemoglobin-like flavoprotein
MDGIGSTKPNDVQQLTPKEIVLLKRTCTLINDTIELASDFYNRLFYLYPMLRPLFKENIHNQASRLTPFLFDSMHDVSNWDDVERGIEEFRQRYLFIDPSPLLYGCAGEALFFVLKNHLQGVWNAEVELTWSRFYSIVIKKMNTSGNNRRQRKTAIPDELSSAC